MIVKQLIENLSKLPGDLKVVIPFDDNGAVELVLEVETGKYNSMENGFEPFESSDINEGMEVNAVRIS
jgi:hypothetical protein